MPSDADADADAVIRFSNDVRKASELMSSIESLRSDVAGIYQTRPSRK